MKCKSNNAQTRARADGHDVKLDMHDAGLTFYQVAHFCSIGHQTRRGGWHWQWLGMERRLEDGRQEVRGTGATRMRDEVGRINGWLIDGAVVVVWKNLT